MAAHVPLQLVPPIESPIAQRTLELVVGRVHLAHVAAQRHRRLEQQRTLVAANGAHRVVRLTVVDQMGAHPERFVAQVALELADGPVAGHVDAQVALELEALLADGALERPLVGVPELVGGALRQRGEALRADRTAERPDRPVLEHVPLDVVRVDDLAALLALDAHAVLLSGRTLRRWCLYLIAGASFRKSLMTT